MDIDVFPDRFEHSADVLSEYMAEKRPPEDGGFSGGWRQGKRPVLQNRTSLHLAAISRISRKNWPV